MTPIGLPLPDVVPVLPGRRVVLRPPAAGDAPLIARLGVDPEIARFFGVELASHRGLTADEARRSVERLTGAPSTQGWVIEAGGRLAGTARLFAVEPAARRAWYSVTLLSHDLVGMGLGTEATRLVLTYAFAVLGLHRVSARVLDFNTRALACLPGLRLRGRGPRARLGVLRGPLARRAAVRRARARVRGERDGGLRRGSGCRG